MFGGVPLSAADQAGIPDSQLCAMTVVRPDIVEVSSSSELGEKGNASVGGQPIGLANLWGAAHSVLFL